MIDVTYRRRFSTLRNYRRLFLVCCLLATLVGAQRVFSAQLLQIQPIVNGPHGGLQSVVKIAANGNPVIAYNSSSGVTVVRCGDTLCSSGNSSATILNSGAGIDLALVLDANDNPVISYHFANTLDLRVARCGNPTCTSGNVINQIDSVGNVGKYNSIQLDSNGNPVISYYDTTNRDLKLIRCGDPNCTPTSN